MALFAIVNQTSYIYGTFDFTMGYVPMSTIFNAWHGVLVSCGATLLSFPKQRRVLISCDVLPRGQCRYWRMSSNRMRYFSQPISCDGHKNKIF